MPTITPGKRANPLDRNAVSADRVRRNFQRLADAGVNDLIQLAPFGALIFATGLAVNVDGESIVINAGNQLAVQLDPAGALSISPAGLAVNVDGVTVRIVGDQLVAAPAGPAPAQVMARISLGV